MSGSALKHFLDSTSEVPHFARAVREGFDDLFQFVAVETCKSFPWNTGWEETEPPNWLYRFLRNKTEFFEAWIRKGAIWPADDEQIVTKMARHFKVSAAHVFLLHGNVQDYLFDGHLGFADLSRILGEYWVQSRLFGPPDVPRHSLVLGYSLSRGISLLQGTKAHASIKAFASDLENHKKVTEGLAHDERVDRDFMFLTDQLAIAGSIPILLIFNRPESLFVSAGHTLSSSVWIERMLDWARVIPPRPKHMIVLTAENQEATHPLLREAVRGILPIHVPRPSSPLQRWRFLAAAMAACSPENPVALAECRMRTRCKTLPFGREALSSLAEATAGLNYRGIERCLLDLLEASDGHRPPAIEYLQQQRAEILRAESHGLLQVIEPRARFDDFRGSAQIQKRLGFVVRGMDGRDPLLQLHLPMGILFVGPPGTGKSLMAEALAEACAKAGVHYVKMGDFRDMWVGQSERNLSNILHLLEAFGRVIVFIDEFDQTEGASRSHDQHETSRRIFGKLLEFMADQAHRGRILWIAASNLPSRIDRALLRPGRFDLVIPFDLPDVSQCQEILSLHSEKSGMAPAAADDMIQQLAQSLAEKKVTGAEIQRLVGEVCLRALEKERTTFTWEELKEVIADFDGASRSAEYERMTIECRQFVPFRSHRK